MTAKGPIVFHLDADGKEVAQPAQAAPVVAPVAAPPAGSAMDLSSDKGKEEKKEEVKKEKVKKVKEVKKVRFETVGAFATIYSCPENRVNSSDIRIRVETQQYEAVAMLVASLKARLAKVSTSKLMPWSDGRPGPTSFSVINALERSIDLFTRGLGWLDTAQSYNVITTRRGLVQCIHTSAEFVTDRFTYYNHMMVRCRLFFLHCVAYLLDVFLLGGGVWPSGYREGRGERRRRGGRG